MTQSHPPFRRLFDAHAHIVADDAAAYPPSPISGRVREGALDDPMTVERLLVEMDTHGVDRAALVQRAHIYGYDNSYVVDAAARYPDRFRAICVIDSTGPGAAARAIDWLGRGAAGIRLTEPSRDAAGDWLHGPQAREVWDAIAAHGGSISVQLYGWNRTARLAEMPALLANYPHVPVIVEHLSNIVETPDAPDHGIDADLAALAAFANVALKLTTINLGRCRGNGVDARAVVARVAALFTPERLLWGSDVAQSLETYAEMTAMARSSVEALSGEAQDLVLHATAKRLFG